MGELTQRDKKMIAGGGVFLILFSLVQFIWLPAVDRKAALVRKSVVLEASIGQMETLRDRYREQAGSLDKDRSFLTRRGKQFTLFSFVDAQAAKSGVKENVVYIKPFSQDLEDSSYSLSRVTVKLQQVSLKGLMDFLYRLETSDKGVSVLSLSLTRTGEPERRLDAVIETQTLEVKKGA